MDFSNFLILQQEGGLVAILVALLFADIFAPEGPRRWFRGVACGLMLLQTVAGFLPMPFGEAFGGMYLSTPMTAAMKNVLNIATLLVLLQSSGWLRKEDTMIRQGEFYTITLATLLGMYFMVSAGNFMMLFIGIETASLPMACLAAFNKYKEKSAEAGAKYIMISAVASGVMLFGISFLYGATGTLYFTDMAAAITSSPLVIMGMVFFLAGLGFKISLVPFHLWTADVYEGAPTGVTAYLSVVSKAAACFALIFTLFHVFSPLVEVWRTLLWGLTVATIVIGNLFALRQKDIKRFFAFSSISQAGYIMLGVIPGTAVGMSSMVYFLFVYLISNLAAFGVITAVENASGRTDIATYNGLRKSNPKLALVMMLALFSLAGIPPFAGFFSKIFIFRAALDQGYYILVLIALINTVVSLYYYLKVVKAMFIDPADENSVGHVKTDCYNKISLVICFVGLIATGFFSCIYSFINGLSWGIM